MNEIVTAVSYRNYVLVFTKNGNIYKVLHDHITERVHIELLVREFLRHD
jgi:hypothetical protein